MKLCSPAAIAALKEKHGFKASKALGQNFLADQNIVDKIIAGAELEDGDIVIEIGPGLGVLTAAAARSASKVIAVELDKRLMPVLAETLSEYKNVKIVQGDILKLDLWKLIQDAAPCLNPPPACSNPNPTDFDEKSDPESKPNAGADCFCNRKNIKIIGNLPYYITTPVIMKVLEEKTPVKSLTVMMQKEVARRLDASPGTKAYGAVTVAVGYYCTVTHITDAPRSVFVPKPGVDSRVLRLDIRKEPPVGVVSEKALFDCIKAGFGQRRKTLQNSLTGLYGLDRQKVSEALAGAGVDPMRRAETLTLSEFAKLADCVCENFLTKGI